MYNKDKIIVLMHTDFPDPVVPATKRCGIEDKSATIDVPKILFPRAIGKFFSSCSNTFEDNISDKTTLSLLGFGISIPTVFFPGTVDTLAETELVFLAMS